ncbi:unnamed protein product [Somion occarium]|uniref:DUF6589 domain-containing protein n=1 Tax=Somion occarium TaxID=3059160 RepID=A0ABP1E6C7_9APHY
MWHTGWTDLNQLIESHWGKLSSRDPSTLAHNAARIKRPTPSNLKKVDYNSGIDLVYLILDARMLDCWQLYFSQQDIFEYFKKLSDEKKVPAFEDLEVAARKLHRAYSSVRGVEYATASVEGTQGHQAAWHRTVPLGSPWTPPTAFDKSTCSNSDNTQQRTRSNSLQPRPLKRRRTEDEETETDDSPFTGDRCLMQSIVFMRDALVSREFTYALAEGDIGRVYEALKIMLFTFAGSSHSKYTTYLLEFIIDLEYESTPELRAAVLNSLVVNLSGKGGHFCAADWLQERNNRIIQMIAERKGVQYNARYLRNVVSRNVHHLSRLLDDIRSGVDLKDHSAKHCKPHENAELTILLQIFRSEEIHSRCPGRAYDKITDARDVDNYRSGLDNLRNGRLQRFITETLHFRHSDTTSSDGTALLADLSEALMEEDSEASSLPDPYSMCSVHLEDGTLVVTNDALTDREITMMIGELEGMQAQDDDNGDAEDEDEENEDSDGYSDSADEDALEEVEVDPQSMDLSDNEGDGA